MPLHHELTGSGHPVVFVHEAIADSRILDELGISAAMVRRALEVQAPRWEALAEELLVADVAERLGEVRAATLVVAGEEDVDDMQVIARRLAAEIPGARLVTIPSAAHVPSLEQPSAFDAHVLPFLAGALG